MRNSQCEDQNMQSFVIFSKTLWSEPPRLRHQVTHLLASYGHKVVFFEKPRFSLGTDLNYYGHRRDNDLIELRRTNMLIHHQLRFTRLLACANEYIERKSISSALDQNERISAVVINFNYDYYFLNKLFPNNKIITIINDDFIATAKVMKGRHAIASLRRTCELSDTVLVVSEPLFDQVSKWCKPKMFYPWAPVPYNPPLQARKRDSILLWGYIDKRIDLGLLRVLCMERPGYSLEIVGPISRRSKRWLKRSLGNLSNITFSEAISVAEINWDAYFCAVIPYVENHPANKAITIANKTLSLMSHGLPIVVSGLPNFLEHEAIFKCTHSNRFIDAIDECYAAFFQLQGAIKELVDSNQGSSRYAQIINEIAD